MQDFLNFYPELDINKKVDRTFISRFLKSGKSFEQAKCSNPNCNHFISWKIGYGFTKYCSKECKEVIKEDLKIDSIKKRKETCSKNYGAEYISQLANTKVKVKDTCFIKYGVSNPSHSKKIKNEKQLRKFNNDETIQKHWHNKNFWIENFIIKDRFHLIKCSEYFKCNQSTAHKQLKKLDIIVSQYYKQSLAEEEINNYISSLIDSKVILGSRSIIKPLELDIYIPDHNLAIEYNGIYWHSYCGQNKHTGKQQIDFNYCKNRHLHKTKLCQTKGIRLFHIFENEWVNKTKQAIWKSIIQNALGRSEQLETSGCTINRVPKHEIKPFLEANHLQGHCTSSIAYGLYHKNELVSIMTFVTSGSKDWELTRFCNKLGYYVLDAAGLLLKAFRTEHKGSIKTCVNRRWSDGNLYKQLGFQEIGISEPNPFYWENKNPYKLIPGFQNINDPSQSNIIWDSGNYIFHLE